jgi:hypothetical protein
LYLFTESHLLLPSFAIEYCNNKNLTAHNIRLQLLK